MGLATRLGAGKGRKNGTVKALMPSCYTGRQKGIRANLTAVSMEEARCRALFLALFTPMLTIEGNDPRLRARSAHFVSHLPLLPRGPSRARSDEMGNRDRCRC